MKLITYLFISLSLFTSLHAQTVKVSGRVLSEADGVPLQETMIVEQSLQLVDYTNAEGYFEIMLPKGRHRIEAHGIGASSNVVEVVLTKDTSINFYLGSLNIDLESVEVTAAKTTNGISRLQAVEDFGIYEAKKNEVILLDDFAANKGANNARQVFAKVPGLNIWESDFAGIQLDIAARGLGPSRTANFNTRQNGYDISADALGYPESYYIPPLQAVERIELVRGAASLQYGPQFGGMLNFKLKEAPHTLFELYFEQSLGSFGLLNSFLSAGGRNEKVEYYGYYQFRTGDGWRTHSNFDMHTAFAGVDFQLNERLQLGLEYSYMYYQAQQPGGLTDERFNKGDLTESQRPRNWFGVTWNLFAATLDYSFSPGTKLNIRTFGLLSGRDALGNLEQIGVPDDPNANRSLITDDFRNFGAEARVLTSYLLAQKEATLLLGARYYNGLTKRKQGLASAGDTPDFELINPENPEDFDYDFPSENWAFFAENLWEITPKLNLTTGVRLEHIRTDSEGTWRFNRYDFAGNLVSSTLNVEQSSVSRWVPLFGIGAAYYLKEDLQLYSNYSRNFRSITFSDLRVVNPNFQLDSLITDESGYNMDLGIRGALGDWVKVDLSFFLLRYNDRIGQYELPGSTTLFRTNIGNSRHLGVEFFGEFDLFELINRKEQLAQLALFVNLALTEASYIESDISSIDNRKVEYVPNIMLRTGLNYRFNGLKATLQLSYLSEQFSDATNSTFNPNALTGIIPAYLVVDLSAEYQLDRFTFSAGINNLGNKKYFTRRAESYPGPGIIPATPRSFYASVGVRF